MLMMAGLSHDSWLPQIAVYGWWHGCRHQALDCTTCMENMDGKYCAVRYIWTGYGGWLKGTVYIQRPCSCINTVCPCWYQCVDACCSVMYGVLYFWVSLLSVVVCMPWQTVKELFLHGHKKLPYINCSLACFLSVILILKPTFQSLFWSIESLSSRGFSAAGTWALGRKVLFVTSVPTEKATCDWHAWCSVLDDY